MTRIAAFALLLAVECIAWQSIASGQDGRAAYGVHSPVGLRHRVFSAGEEAEVSIHLMNRLGGGTYRITCAVTSCDGREILASEQNGLLFFVEPVPNAYGSAELEGIELHFIDPAIILDGRSKWQRLYGEIIRSGGR